MREGVVCSRDNMPIGNHYTEDVMMNTIEGIQTSALWYESWSLQILDENGK